MTSNVDAAGTICESVPPMSELSYVSASELARRIADKDISPVEVIEDAISRITLRNPTLTRVRQLIGQ